MSLKKFFDYPKYFDFALVLRGIVAYVVVYWHVEGCVLTSESSSFFVTSGRAAVWIFFSLSGFLLTSGFRSGRYSFTFLKLKDFYINRFLRIYPLFFFVSLCSIVGHYYFLNKISPLNWEFINRNFLMLQWQHAYVLNGAFWTLGVEMQFYLLFPLIIYFQIKWNKPFASFIFYISLFTVQFLFKKVDPTIFADCRNLLGNLMHFQLGVVACFYQDKIRRHITESKPVYHYALYAFTLILFLASNRYFRNHSDAFYGWKGILLIDAMTFCLLVMHLKWEHEKIPLNLFTKILVVSGLLSYGVYAWHPLVQLFSPENERNVLFVTAVSYLLALLTYAFLEKNVLKLKK
jgi:peptidoglycan/LPS O-acetylase OafA/YrhL